MSIGEKKAKSFFNFSKSVSGNTSVEIDPRTNEVKLKLFGNHIATMDSNRNQLSITNAGWKTVTTKDRLNHVLRQCYLNVGIQQEGGNKF